MIEFRGRAGNEVMIMKALGKEKAHHRDRSEKEDVKERQRDDNVMAR